MKFNDKQLAWLEKATAKDISRVFAKKDMDFKDKMNVQRKWLEIHQDNRLDKEVYESNWWAK